MALTERLAIVVDADATDAVRQFGNFSDAARKADTATDGFAQRAGQVGDKLTSFGLKATAVTTLPIAAAFTGMANAASDLAEATNVTGLVFSESRAKIDAFVKTTAEGLGQSERAAREATATFGGLLQNLGLNESASADWSITLTKLASDLGSAFNVEPAEAVQAIGAALRGETEPIRRFNVMLDDASVRTKAVEMGLAASTAEVDKNGKAQAALAEIMEQTQAVQGDFANTADGAANSQRILKARFEDTAAQLGESLLPIAQKVIDAAGGMLDVFSDMDPAMQNVVIAGAAMVAAIGPISTVAGTAIKGVQGLTTAVQFLAVSQATAGVAAAGFGIALAGVAAGYAGYRILLSSIHEANQQWIDDMALAANNAALGAEATNEQAAAAYIAGISVQNLGGNIDELNKSAELSDPVIRRAREALDSLSESSGVSKQRIVDLANELGINLGDQSDEAREKLSAAIAEIAGGVTPTERLGQVTEGLGQEFATSAESVDAFNEAVDAMLGSLAGAEEAQIRVRQKSDELREAIEAGREEGESWLQQKDRLKLKTIDLIGAMEDEVRALVENGQIATDTASQHESLRQRLVDLQNQFPELAGEIQPYIDRLDSIPTNVDTTVTANDQASGTIDAVQAKLDRLTKGGVIGFITGLGQADGGIVGFADGTENHMAQIAPAGAWRVWAEPETGGEAYIPLSPAKRARSVGILEEVARQFGFALLDYARGGTYDVPVRMAADMGAIDKRIASMVPGGNLVQVGQWLQRQGYAVGEHPAFGGVRGKHTPKSFHYRGRAIDINWRGRNEPAALDRVAPVLRGLPGVAEWLWRVPGHFDHAHLAMASGGILGGKAKHMAAGGLLPSMFPGGSSPGTPMENWESIQAAFRIGVYSEDDYKQRLRERLSTFQQWTREWAEAYGELVDLEKKAEDERTQIAEDAKKKDEERLEAEKQREEDRIRMLGEAATRRSALRVSEVENAYKLGFIDDAAYVMDVEKRLRQAIKQHGRFSDEATSLELEQRRILERIHGPQNAPQIVVYDQSGNPVQTAREVVQAMRTAV